MTNIGRLSAQAKISKCRLRIAELRRCLNPSNRRLQEDILMQNCNQKQLETLD